MAALMASWSVLSPSSAAKSRPTAAASTSGPMTPMSCKLVANRVHRPLRMCADAMSRPRACRDETRHSTPKSRYTSCGPPCGVRRKRRLPPCGSPCSTFVPSSWPMVALSATSVMAITASVSPSRTSSVGVLPTAHSVASTRRPENAGTGAGTTTSGTSSMMALNSTAFAASCT